MQTSHKNFFKFFYVSKSKQSVATLLINYNSPSTKNTTFLVLNRPCSSYYFGRCQSGTNWNRCAGYVILIFIFSSFYIPINVSFHTISLKFVQEFFFLNFAQDSFDSIADVSKVLINKIQYLLLYGIVTVG